MNLQGQLCCGGWPLSMRPRDYLLSREDRLGKGRKHGDRSGKRLKGKENNRGNRTGDLHPESAENSEESL